MTVTVHVEGDELIIPIPTEFAQAAGLGEGTEVEVAVTGKSLHISSASFDASHRGTSNSPATENEDAQ